MPAIRWLGYAGNYRGVESLEWEFLRDKHLEVSAEWTIKNRPFIIPNKREGLSLGTGVQFGLLVASKAVNRRFRRDGGSGANKERKRIPKNWRRKDLIQSELLTIKPWEALCKKEYKAFVLIKDKLLYYSPTAELEFCKQHNIPTLIYQEHYDSGAISSWSLSPYETRA